MKQRRSFPIAACAAALLLAAAPAPDSVSGVVRSIAGADLLLQTRTGSVVHVDASSALAAGQAALLRVGRPLTAIGARGADGALHASAVARAKDSPALWPPDK